MKYHWVPWFTELSKIIIDGGEDSLIDRAKKIDWPGRRALLEYGDEHIDPFSFVYFLASKNTKKHFVPAFRSVHDVFGIESSSVTLENETLIIPTPSGMGTLFHDGKNFNPDLLWNFFLQTVEGSVQRDLFEAVLEIPNVGISKLTQTMFLINPNEYFPIDKNGAVIPGKFLSDDSKSALKIGKKTFPTKIDFDSVVQITTEIRELFPSCQYYEINEFLYRQKSKDGKGLINKNSKYFQISSKAYGNEEADYWESTPDDDEEFQQLTFNENSWIFTGVESIGNKTYPIRAPKKGDVILVRTGRRQGRAVGVVTENQYSDGWSENRKIQVLWINKTTETLARYTTRKAITRVPKNGPTYRAFADCDAYQTTFSLIDSLVPDDESQPPNIPLNQILYGPPGTGKTWHTVNLSLAIVCEKSLEAVDEEERMEFDDHQFNVNDGSGQFAFTTFHQNYAYEDFIEGIRPTIQGSKVGFEIRDGLFKKLADAAKENSDKRYVLIIDEINRGNIAKIFGELITLIEDSKRLGKSDAIEVMLPYSQRSFGVPSNLYIIGTMNTADHSIQILDTALRRRFTFLEMMPGASHAKIPTDVEGVNCQKILEIMNRRIFALLDRERQIGHTYFFDIKSIERLAEVFQNRIIPLLQEYFFDDWSKIKTVLGNNEFVQGKRIDDRSLDEYLDSENSYYERLPVDDEKWKNPAHYRKIYETE